MNKIFLGSSAFFLTLVASFLLGAVSSQVCIPGFGCITGDSGGDIWIDTDDDGVIDVTESNLTVNAPKGTDGNETVQGSLTVNGPTTFTGDGVSFAHEAFIAGVYPTTTAIAVGNCWKWDQNDAPIAACDVNGYTTILTYKTYLTRVCIAQFGAASWGASSGDVDIELYDATNAVILATIKVNTAGGGDWAGVANTGYCETLGVTKNQGVNIQLRRGAIWNTYNPQTRWILTLNGYGVN